MTKKNSIAIVLPAEEPFSPINGGALSTWTFEVYSLLTQCKSRVFCPTNSSYYSHIKRFAIPVSLLRSLSKYIWPKNLSFFVKYSVYPLVVAIACRIYRVKYIHIHNRPQYVKVIKRWNKASIVIIHMNNDHLITNSEESYTECVRHADTIIGASEYITNGILSRANALGLVIKSLEVVNNGAKVLDKTPSKKSQKHVNCLFIGRLVPEKGVKEMILAFKEAHAMNSNLTLTIIGNANFDNKSSSYVEDLKNLVSETEIPIQFTGHLPRTEILEYLNNAHIYLVPSIWNDPFPLSVIEGMSVGLPVISTKRGGIPEALGENGIYIDPEDTELFVKEIIRLANDEDLRNKLGSENYNRFKSTYTWQCISNDFKTYLANIEKVL